MNKKSLFFFLSALILILAIFLFVPTKSKKNKSENEPSNSVNYTLENYQSDFIQRQSDSVKGLIHQLEEKIAKANDSLAKVNALSEGINLYNQLQSPEISSLLVFQKAEIIKNTNSWKVTGDNFIALLTDMKLDTNLIQDVAHHATLSYEKSIALDSNNVEAKLQLAQCYMEMSQQPMNGVQLLLGVVRKDSTNTEAQLLLAKFGLRSGQYEKVLQRVENVLSLHPQNLDALLMRAEAYAQTGKASLAAKDLRVVKSDPKTPKQMKEQLEIAIKDLETKKETN